MKDYQVKYYLGDMLHTYVIEAKSEYEAYQKVLKRIPETSQHLFRELKIERYYSDWN